MSIDEPSVMDGSKCILQLRGVRPFLSDKYDITRHKNYRCLSDSNPKNAFSIEKYLSYKLKVRPDDMVLLHEFTETGEYMPDAALKDYHATVEETDDIGDDVEVEVDLEPF